MKPSTSTTAEQRYLERTPASHGAFEAARGVIPGAVPGGLAFMTPYPLFIERGDGCWVWDADGNRMLDLMCGDWLLPLGHGNPGVLEAVRDQLTRGTTFGTPDPTSGLQLASLLQERMPSLERLRFTASGTEATMQALRLARVFTGRSKIAKMRGGYHGTHDVSLVSNGRYREPDQIPPGLIPGTVESVVVLSFNNIDETVSAIKSHASELAAVIVEPMLGSAGMLPMDEEYLEALRGATSRCGALLVFDEVVTFSLAFGGAQGRYGIRPDITCLGKAIGGGLPLGAFGGRADVLELVDPMVHHFAPMRHASTCGGIPICLAAGAAQVAQLTPEVHAHLDALGDRLRGGLADVARQRNVPLQVTGAGQMFGLHWTERSVVDFDSALTSDRRFVSQLVLSLINKGHLMFTSGQGFLSSPTSFDDVDGFVDAVGRSLDETL